MVILAVYSVNDYHQRTPTTALLHGTGMSPTPASTSSAPTGTTPRSTLRAVFVDANPTLGDIAQELSATIDIPFAVNRQPDIRSEALPATLAGAGIAVIDHTHFPTAIARQCGGLAHVVFLGTG